MSNDLQHLSKALALLEAMCEPHTEYANGNHAWNFCPTCVAQQASEHEEGRELLLKVVAALKRADHAAETPATGWHPVREERHMEAVERAVDELFVNGQGEQAHRLVLTGMDGRDLGGWCKQAVINTIERALTARKDGSDE